MGSMMTFSRMRVEDLATAGEDYVCYSGMTSHWIGTYDAAQTQAPDNNIGFRYNRSVSTSWQSITSSGGTSTVNDLISVTADETVCFMGFCNGDGSRVDFYYSNDLGATWTIGTSHTTNIPTSSSNPMTLGGAIAKTAGTTDRRFFVSQISGVYQT